MPQGKRSNRRIESSWTVGDELSPRRRRSKDEVTNLKYLGTTARAVCSAGVIFALFQPFLGAHLALGFDEGIYLHSAQRILAGQHIYRDFFALTGPGTFWLLAVWFKVFSTSLAAGHALLSLENAISLACIFLIVGKFVNRVAGLAAAGSFLGLLMVFAHRLYMNHRWDSLCCVTVSLAFLLLSQGRPVSLLLAGFFAGAAGLFTPPVLLVPLAVGVALAFDKPARRQALWFSLGFGVPLAAGVVVLAAQGGLAPMLAIFSWVGRHYSAANRVPYGFIPPETGTAASGVSLLRRVLVCVPPALPVLAIAACSWLAIRRILTRPMKILLVAGLALAASCYPRLAANNLLFAAPLLVCFLLIAGRELVKPPVYRAILFFLAAVSVICVFWTITGQPPRESVSSQLGTVNCSPRDAHNIEFATHVIQPGDSLFVYPYQPIWYSLAGAGNPTRYDFLQPGMMTLDDETAVLAELTAHPPEWVIWHNLPPRTVLSIWPHSDPTTLHFNRIEQFIRTRYSQVKPSNPNFRYAIAIFHRNG